MADTLLGETVRKGQKKQAERMQLRSKKFFPEVMISDFAILPVPDVDRGLSDLPYLSKKCFRQVRW